MEQINPDSQINKDWFHRHKLFLATLVIVICGAGLLFQWKLNYFRARVNTDFPVTQHAAAPIPSDWKTYTNDEDGFRFKYPKDWSITNHDDIISLFSSELVENVEDPGFDIGIIKLDNSKQVSLNSFIKSYEQGWYEEYKEKTNVNLNGIDGIQYSDFNSQIPHIPIVATLFQNNSDIFVVACGYKLYCNIYENNIYENILSSIVPITY